MLTRENQTAEIVEAELVEEARPQTSLLEQLLSPQSLQVMMASGGGLLAIGFAVWLWSTGVFDHPMVLATSVGAANLLLLAAGIGMLKFTRFKQAGQGLTFLSSLLLPLNLWLYDSQGLIVLSQGEALWVPALFCCVIYAAVARVTKSATFVYTLVGGVGLTGVLFLASFEALGSMYPMVAFLVALGGVCIYADSWFLDIDSPFNRDKFGKALFNAGHLSLLTGLTILLGIQFGGIVNEFISIFKTSTAIQSGSVKYWPFGILALASPVYFYSSMTRRRHWAFTLAGALTLAFAAVELILLLQISIGFGVGLIIVTSVLLAANILLQFAGLDENKLAAYQICVGLGASAVMTIALGQYLLDSHDYFAGWKNVLHFVLSSSVLVSLPGLGFNSRNDVKKTTPILFIASSGMAIAYVASVAGSVLLQAPIAIVSLAGVAALVSIAGLFIEDGKVATAVGNAFSVIAAMLWFSTILVAGVSFTSGVSLTVVALVAVSGVIRFYGNNDYPSAAIGACGVLTAIAQAAVLFDCFSGYALIYSAMAAGIISILAAVVLRRLNAKAQPTQLTHNAGNSLICFAGLAAILVSLEALSIGMTSFFHVGMLAAQVAAVVFASVCNRNIAWRRCFTIAGIALSATMLGVMINSATLSSAELAQVISVGCGLVMLGFGFLGWWREKDGSKTDLVSFNLIMGSWAVVAPFAICIVFDRWSDTAGVWRYIHEIGGLSAALILLAAGTLCRIRSTTISGATLLAVYVLSNVLLINFPDQLQQTSVLMMIGGGAFFAIAILLSVYREALVALPGKVMKREGVFGVLDWR